MKKRLQIHRETLRNLEADLISKAAGGISTGCSNVTGCTTIGSCSNCDGTLCPPQRLPLLNPDLAAGPLSEGRTGRFA